MWSVMSKVLKSLKKCVIAHLLKLQKSTGTLVARRLSRGKPFPAVTEKVLPQNKISKSHQNKDKSELISLNDVFKPTLMEVRDVQFAMSKVKSKKKKIVIFGPEWYGSRPSFTMNQLKESARRVGYEAVYVDFVKLLASQNKNNQGIRDLFISSMKIEKPDYVLIGFTDSYVFPYFKGIDSEFIENVRSQLPTPFSLINVCGDLWRREDQLAVESWRESCDLFLHIDEFSMRKLSKEVQGKALFYPFIGLEDFPNAQDKNYLELFYSGQVRDSDRRIILNNVLKKLRNSQVLVANFKVHYAWDEDSALTEAKYRQSMSNADFCISFAQKGPAHYLIPWRSLEALSAGSVLIHQQHEDFSPLTMIANSNEHYLPFLDEESLLTLLSQIEKNPRDYLGISIRAQKFFKSRYSDWNFWELVDLRLNNRFNHYFE